MTALAAHAAIKSRIQGASLGVSICWPNTILVKPDPPALFLQVRFVGGDSDQVTIGAPGNNLFRDIDGLQIMVYAPSTFGDEEAMTMAETLAALFRGWSSGSLRFWAPRINPLGEGEGVDANWYLVEVYATFEYDRYA